MGVDFQNSLIQQGHFVPSLVIGGRDFRAQIEKGQSVALTGIAAEAALASLEDAPNLDAHWLFGKIKSRDARNDGTALILLVTPEVRSAPARNP